MSHSSAAGTTGFVSTRISDMERERFDANESHDANAATCKSPLVRLLESSFLGATPLDEIIEEEMKDMEGCVKIEQSAVTKCSAADDFDTCREYSYSSGDEEDEQSYFQTQAAPKVQLSDESSLVHLLGKTYHATSDYDARRDDESSLFWFTYRCDFPEISPYGITSDAGWGCMLRSAMMLLAQTMRMHYKGRSWKPPMTLQQRRHDPFVRSLLTWFADFPSSASNIYSLHNMVAAGLDRHVLPGEWYGPGTACYVLRDLVELHERQQMQSASPRKTSPKIFRVHVAGDASVYKSTIETLMASDTKAKMQQERTRLQAESKPSHPLDHAWECELVELESKIQWDTSLLLLIPLRLGLKSFNTEYVQALAHVFSLSQSVGVLGGRPRGARWFYGAIADGSKIYGLDPHTVQASPRKRLAVVNNVSSQVVELSDDYLRSMHTNFPEAFCLSKMDPSIALGFYCKDKKDFLALASSLERWKRANPTLPELFSVSDTAPDYAAHDSLMMDDMMSRSMMTSMVDEDGSVASDDEGYVVL